MKEYFFYFLIALVGGVISGMGGGTLLIPLFTIFTSLSQIEAQGYNLAAFIPMAAVALVIHKKNGYLKAKGLLPLIISAAIFSVAGGCLATLVGSAFLKKLFGVFLLTLSVWQTFYLFKGENGDKKVSGKRHSGARK